MKELEAKSKMQDIILSHARNSGDYLPDYQYEKTINEIYDLLVNRLDAVVIPKIADKNNFAKMNQENIDNLKEAGRLMFDAVNDLDAQRAISELDR